MKIQALIRKILITLSFLFILPALSYGDKTIAITIDDLPFVGEYRNFHLDLLIKTLQEHQVKATGFVIAREVHKDNWRILNKFRDAGLDLGSHTFSHANLNQLSIDEYIEEIRKADKILSPVMTEPKYFRYPYLAMSSGAKREAILCYLQKKHYEVAPITIDSKDFVFNQRLLSVRQANRRAYLEELKPFYLDFIWQQTLRAEEHDAYHHAQQSQILLIHANLLNAYVLGDIITMYEENGYRFVGLEQALKTQKYAIACGGSKKKHAKQAKSKIKLAQTKIDPIMEQELQFSPPAEPKFDDFLEWS